MAKCNDCLHYEVCKKHGATVDFDVDDGVCLHFAKDTNAPSKIEIRYKDFEIRPAVFIDGHKDPNKFDVVKWKKRDKPIQVYDIGLGKMKMSDRFCFSIAQIEWNEKEPCWEFSSVGTRFLKYYEEGLCEFIREWLEMTGERKDNE